MLEKKSLGRTTTKRGSIRMAARIALREGLRLYWKHLVPITILPTILVVLLNSVPERWVFSVFVIVGLPLFYRCGFYASFPYRKKNVTYRFWIVAVGCWLFGAVPAFIVLMVIKAVFHS